MGLFGDILGAVAAGMSSGGSSPDDLGCDWFCDNCGAYMNEQDGFTTEDGAWECEECGYENDVSEDNIVDDDDCDDGTNPSYDDDDEIPEGCEACGGDYPNCKDSCPLFDD